MTQSELADVAAVHASEISRFETGQAKPYRSQAARLAAVLGIQGPASRFGEQAMVRAFEPLLARAAAVSDALGWRPTAKEGS